MRGEPELDSGDETGTDVRNLDRRSLIATTIGLTVGVAGCSGSDQTDSDTADSDDGGDEGTDGDSSDTSSGGVFEEIAFEGRELKVSVSDDSIARINVIWNGEQVGNAEFSTGVSRATVLRVDQTLHGEELELIAVDGDGDEIDSTTEAFAAQPEITGFRTQAMKNDREATAEGAAEHVGEFATVLATVENTGDGPLFIDKWGARGDSTVFLTDGVPRTATPDEAGERTLEPTDKVLVPAGGSAEVVPFKPAYGHLMFHTNGSEKDEWPESVRSMGEFPDGYADGDEVDIPVVIEDDTGERVETAVTATYDGGLLQIERLTVDQYVPAEFTAGNRS